MNQKTKSSPTSSLQIADKVFFCIIEHLPLVVEQCFFVDSCFKQSSFLQWALNYYNAKIYQKEETEWVIGAISLEFQCSPWQFLNATDFDIARLISQFPVQHFILYNLFSTGGVFHYEIKSNYSFSLYCP